MTTQPPIRHRAMEMMLTGLESIRSDAPEGVLDTDTLAELDRCIELLRPMRGLGVTDVRARLRAVAHSIRVLAEDLAPHVTVATATPVAPFPPLMAKIEERLQG